MSGIIGSKLNIRGSGLVGSLGTDGQHLLSAGAGVTNVFETAAGGGKVGQVIQALDSTQRTTTSSSFVDMSTALIGVITPTATTSKILIQVTSHFYNGGAQSWGAALYKDVAGGGYAQLAAAMLELEGCGCGGGGTFISYLDSPSSTSELSYRPYCKISGSGVTLSMNYAGTQGSIQVMEILA